MHLIPAERAHRHTIDAHHVCEAIAGIGEAEAVREAAAELALLADPTRLMLLLGIAAAPDISVTDLAIAVGMNDTTVSQALRLLRTAGVVVGRKDGRVVRYRVADGQITDWLEQVRQRLATSKT